MMMETENKMAAGHRLKELSFAKNEYLVKKFPIGKPYQKFEIELPTSVKRVQAVSVTHDYYDNPEVSLGQVSLLSKDKNDIILKAGLQGAPLFYYIPNLYQKASFNYFSITNKHYIAKSNFINCCVGNTANRYQGNNLVYKGDQLLADLYHQVDATTNLPYMILDPHKKNVLTGGRRPMAKDDNSKGLSIGSLWVFGTELYICQDATAGSAVWQNNPLPEWLWFTIQSDQKPYELMFRKKRFAFEDKFTLVDVNNDSRFIDVVVHQAPQLPNNPYLIGNGHPLSFNLWVYLVCERIST
jgi:hypothetical protein